MQCKLIRTGKGGITTIENILQYIKMQNPKEQLRGYEGEAASIYFVFDELILQQKRFSFRGRVKTADG